MKNLFVALLTLILTLPMFAQDMSSMYGINFYDALDKGNYSMAEILLSQWQEAGGSPTELTLAEASLRMRSDSTSTVAGEELFRKAIASSPENLSYPLRFMEELALAGKISEALEVCKGFCAEVDRDVQLTLFDTTIPADSVDLYVGSCFAGMVDNLSGKLTADEILDLTEGMVSCYPGGIVEGMTRYHTGFAMYNQERTEAAINQWEKAVGFFDEPYKSEIHLNLALLYAMKGDLLNAGINAEHAQKEGPEDIRTAATKLIEDMNGSTVPYRYYTMVLLSKLALETQPSPEGEATLLDPTTFNENLRQAGYKVDRDINPISALKVESDFGNTIVWSMPEPKDFIDCLYVAFVPADSCYRFITLEKTFDNEGKESFILCESVYQPESEGYKHSNFNTYFDRSLTPEQFGRIASDIVHK